MEQAYFDGPTGTFPESTVCLKRLSSLIPIGTFQPVNFVHLHLFNFFHQFQALGDLFQTGWVFHVNGKHHCVISRLGN